ncbi:MAG: tetratricopeptide repeat protein [Gammaproteobacteria bacterium]|nr:tetratricopeptide repeat protein [Gammaproteobacteria bacterium]MCF6230835.1 tetratricopeptide repeat protein [Gammaproteobacteria bacterium]
MSQDVYIFEATEKNFPSIVIDNSQKIPVLVGFMGVWSEPCFVVADLFSELAKEFASQFIFAKVDIDEQPELRKRYQIENLPTVVVISNGEVVGIEVGQLDELSARALLKKFGVFHASDVLREQAREKHLAGETATAINLLSQAIRQHPSNTRIAMDMVQIFIDIGDLEGAKALFAKLPEQDRNSDIGKGLSGQITVNEYAVKTVGIDALQAQLQSTPDDAEARFDLAICLMSQHDYQAAMEHLLSILKSNPDFKGGGAKEMMINIIRTLTATTPELAKTYQRKFSQVMAE